MSDDKAAPKKKGGMMMIIIIAVGALVLGGGGVGAGLYFSGALGGGGGEAHVETGPKLIPKADEKKAALEGAGGEGGHGEGSGKTETGPLGSGGDKYASTYYTMDKEFTSNLQDSVHFIQVGIAVSTPYDDRVLVNLKTHEIAIRSAILMELGQTTEEQVFSADGKKQLQRRLTKAINDTLQQKEGFGGISNVYFTNFVVQ